MRRDLAPVALDQIIAEEPPGAGMGIVVDRRFQPRAGGGGEGVGQRRRAVARLDQTQGEGDQGAAERGRRVQVEPGAAPEVAVAAGWIAARTPEVTTATILTAAASMSLWFVVAAAGRWIG